MAEQEAQDLTPARNQTQYYEDDTQQASIDTQLLDSPNKPADNQAVNTANQWIISITYVPRTMKSRKNLYTIYYTTAGVRRRRWHIRADFYDLCSGSRVYHKLLAVVFRHPCIPQYPVHALPYRSQELQLSMTCSWPYRIHQEQGQFSSVNALRNAGLNVPSSLIRPFSSLQQLASAAHNTPDCLFELVWCTHPEPVGVFVFSQDNHCFTVINGWTLDTDPACSFAVRDFMALGVTWINVCFRVCSKHVSYH